MNIEDLEFEITKLAAHINAATAKWFDLLAEFDEQGGYERWECRSTAEWLNWRCGIDLGAAREKVRTAIALRRFPYMHRTFAEGRLSYSKVRTLTRVATEETEKELCELALISTATQLEKISRSIRRAKEAAGLVEPDRFFSWHHEDDGTVSFSARLAPEEAAVVIAAVKKSGDTLRKEKVSAETFSAHRVNQADAFVAMAMASFDGEVSENDERYQVVVHVDASEMTATTEDGFDLSPETAKRLSCDSSVITQIENSEGEILSVGRKTRAIPTPIRRALRSRDGGCQFPGCEATRFVDSHHIKHWARGGETKLSNLVTLCRRHHRLCHDQKIFIAQHGAEFEFITRHGERLHRMYCTKGNPQHVLADSLDVSADTLAGTGEPLTNFALDVIVNHFVE